MDQVTRFYRNRKYSINEIDDLLSLFEDVYELSENKKEDYYRQIALIHLLVGYETTNCSYSNATIQINKWIYKLKPIINNYRAKYSYGKI